MQHTHTYYNNIEVCKQMVKFVKSFISGRNKILQLHVMFDV